MVGNADGGVVMGLSWDVGAKRGGDAADIWMVFQGLHGKLASRTQ